MYLLQVTSIPRGRCLRLEAREARLNRNEKHEHWSRSRGTNRPGTGLVRSPLNFEIADAKGAHWRRRLSDFFSASQLGNLHD